MLQNSSMGEDMPQLQYRLQYSLNESKYFHEQLEAALVLPVLAIVVVFFSIFLVIVFKRNPALVLSITTCCTLFLLCYLIMNLAPNLKQHYM